MTQPHPFIDTNVFIRLLTGDDPAKQEAACQLFEQVEAGTLVLPRSRSAQRRLLVQLAGQFATHHPIATGTIEEVARL